MGDLVTALVSVFDLGFLSKQHHTIIYSVKTFYISETCALFVVRFFVVFTALNRYSQKTILCPSLGCSVVAVVGLQGCPVWLPSVLVKPPRWTNHYLEAVMVGIMDTEALAKYLEKQREIRLLSEEVESLKTNEAIGQALKIKHELEALMADYELTAEQLMEVLVVFFGVNKPKKLTGDSESSDSSSSVESRGESSPAPKKAVESQGVVAPRNEATASLSPGRAPSGEGKPARKVTIRRKRAFESESGDQVSPTAPASDGVNSIEADGQNANVAERSKSTAVKKTPAKRKSKTAVESRGGKGRRRKLRVYTNPHTGEEVKTRGANHRTLNEWRTQYGRDAVDQWWVEP